jgi:hypothetical protein
VRRGGGERFRLGVLLSLLALGWAHGAHAQSLPGCTNGVPSTCASLYSVCYPHVCELIDAPPYFDGYYCVPEAYAAAGSACETDSNACTSDVCDGSGTCDHNAVAAGTACPDDGNVCTTDVCSGTTCTHPADPGVACTSDGNPCTTDVCNASAVCEHDATGGNVCGASCINAGTCCPSPNTCAGTANGTGVCSGVGGSCSISCNSGYLPCGSGCIPNGSCCTSANCSGGMTCAAPGDSCACPGGTYNCGGTCIANATCCNNPNNCPGPSSGTGTGVCSGLGGTCSLSCSGGYKTCGNACIPSTQCCVDTDCPSDSPDHRHGICGSGGVCAYACDTGYKACGTSCIATAQCCSAADCTAPPSGCYKTSGACNDGTCIYPLNDGAACNADNNACTPNDSCKGGTCMADTAHLVTCVQRACYGTIACNPADGNCEGTAVPNNTPCGGNGCTAAGTCTAGVCSSPTKDCSSLNTDCKVGICDPTLPPATDCTTNNQTNGTACTLTDRCQLQVACSGGLCIGTPKVCTASGPCNLSTCNSATGNCDSSLAPVGTACTVDGSCLQNATCDANGKCNGDPVPDGTPCDDSSCTSASACVSGACTCIEAPDFGGGLAPIIPGDVDMSATVPAHHSKGCTVAAGDPPVRAPGALFVLVLALAILARRRLI